MADFSALIAQIEAYVKQNGNNEITGNGLQDILVAMVGAIGGALNDAVSDLESADTTLTNAIGDEELARQGADNTLGGRITAEEEARAGADTGLQNQINGINGKIPDAASSTNKLADKAFVQGLVDTLTASIAAINEKIPSEASSSNKLADKAFVQALTTALQNALNTLNGKVPAAATSENQLADKAFVTSLTTALQNAINAINTNIGNGFVYAGVATPSGTPVSGKVAYLTAQEGTYTNYGGLVVPAGISVIKYDGTNWSQEQIISMETIYRNPLMGLYDCDTSGSTAAKTVTAVGYILPTNGGAMKVRMANHTTVDNVTLNINGTGAKDLYYKGKAAGINNTWGDGAVLNVIYDSTNDRYLAYNANAGTGDGVFDVSEYTGDDYARLEDAIADIPVSEQHGGMMIRFVRSSDNKYVQYRLMSITWSATVANWQGVDSDIKSGSKNIAESGAVANLHNNAYLLAQGNGTDWSKVIVACYVKNWTGGDKRLYLDYCYRNDADYGSGIRLNICDADLTNGSQVVYWTYSSPINKTGLEVLPFKNITGGYGQISIVVNWNAIPNQFNSILTPKYYLDLQLIQSDENFTKELKSVVLNCEDLVKLTSYDYQNFNFVGYLNTNGTLLNFTGWHSTDYIKIPNGVSIYTKKLEYNNSHVGFVCYYDSNKQFISSLSNVGDLGEYKIESDSIPSNCCYIRCTSLDDTTTTEQRVDIFLTSGCIAKNIEDIAQNTEDIAQNTEDIADINSKLITQSSKVAGLEDTDYYTSGYGQKGIGEYTRPEVEDYDFNKVVLRGVNLANNESCEYKIYLCYSSSFTEQNGYVTNHKITPSTHTLIKEGTLTKNGSGHQDYEITLNDFVTVPAGKQIFVYLKGVSNINIKGTGGTAPSQELIVNGQLFSLSSGADIWSDSWYSGYRNYCAMSLWLYKEPIFVPQTELEDKIEEISIPVAQQESQQVVNSHITYGLKIQLPNVIYAIVGTEMNLWHDTLCFSVDRGLVSPLNYSVQWDCSVGLVTERCYRFTPTATQVGNNYTLICYVYNIFGELLAQKTVTIKVLSKSILNSEKNIVYFGDSLGSSTALNLYADFNNSEKFTGTKPKMLGTQSEGSVHFEAVGGYEWSSYATHGEVGFRVPVSGITSLGVDAIYTDTNNRAFKVKEVNIVDGTGNILLYKHFTGGQYNYGDLVLPDGTLTKRSGTGDDTIQYVGAYEESTNPLWNNQTNQLDINQYKQRLIELGQLTSLSDKIDAVSFQFGINDRALASNLPQLMTYIDNLYNLFIDDNPNCKFIIGLTTTSGNTLDGAGANYGASWNNATYKWQVYTIRDFYLTLQNSADYPNIRIAPINNEVDRYYGYSFSTREISQRDSNTEQYHNNCVHPGSIGYGQMGDAYFAMYIGVLTE